MPLPAYRTVEDLALTTIAPARAEEPTSITLLSGIGCAFDVLERTAHMRLAHAEKRRVSAGGDGVCAAFQQGDCAHRQPK